MWHARGEDDVFRQMYELFYEEWGDFPDVAYMLELPADCESDSDKDYVWLTTTVAATESAWLTPRDEWPFDGNLEDDQRVRFSRFTGFESGEWSVDIEVNPNDVLHGWIYHAFTVELDEVLSVFEPIPFHIWLTGRLAEEGMTHLELAARSGVPKSTIAMYSQSLGSPTATDLAAIAGVLGPYESKAPFDLKIVDAGDSIVDS